MVVPAAQPVQRATREDTAKERLLWVAAAIFAVVFLFFLPLLGPLRALRPPVMDFFLRSVLPAAVAHLLCLVALSIGFRGKAVPALVFWGASLIGFLAIGQFRFVLAFGLVTVAAILFAAVGDGVARAMLPVERCSWAINLGFGILVSSVIGSVLAWFHLFHWWSVALAMVPLVMLTLRRRSRELPGWRGRVASSLRASFQEWNLAKALVCEGVFLLSLFALVGASAPETRSDAIRIYWPYVKLLDHFGGFIEMPFQWSYIIPQPGLSFSATVLACFGPIAVRFSMLLVLFALVGICVRGSLIARPPATALAILVGSCPVVLWTASSLYQDAFVSLVVVLLAVVCTEGRKPGSAVYWTAVGGLVGLAWCAKYSAVCYVIPLGIWAVVRGRPVGWSKNLGRCLGLGCGSALLVAAPWLAHSYDQSGNPVFPFLSRSFPSPLWPEDLTAFGSMVFSLFSLRSGIGGLLMTPFDLTFHTDRFVEGPAGFLGLAFPTLITLALVAVVRGRQRSRILIAAGIVGTALVWRNTGYVRYWLPGLWLMGAGVAGEMGNIFPGRRSGFAASSIGVIFAVLQVPFSMITAWGDPDGWPWKLYRGSVSEEQYLERMPGFQALRRMEESHPPWPRFWYTGLESVGNVKGIPIMAEFWEFGVHGATNLESITRYVEKARCDYWVVQTDSLGARYLNDLGLGARFWVSENLFASEGALRVYRLPPRVP